MKLPSMPVPSSNGSVLRCTSNTEGAKDPSGDLEIYLHTFLGGFAKGGVLPSPRLLSLHREKYMTSTIRYGLNKSNNIVGYLL